MPNTRPPIDHIDLTRRRYDALGYPSYAWVHNPTPPAWQPLPAPLARCRLALIGSGGIYARGQRAFHYKDDTSFRLIRSDTAIEDLRATHFAYDLTDARRDPNVVFPLGTLRELVGRKALGALTEHAFAFMGGIYSARKVRDWLAPALAEHLRRERADAALLVPV